MRKLVVIYNPPGYKEKIAAALPDWEIVHVKSVKEALPHMKHAEILLGGNNGLSQEILEPAKKLRWIQLQSAGVDYMDMKILQEKSIYLTSASGVHANSISETVLGIMLAFSRQLFNIHIDQMNKHWNHDYSDLGGLSEIHGKTLGILGVGAIGRELARLAKAFNMQVLGCRRSGEASENVDEMYKLDDMHTLLSRCDYVVNILPLTDETKGIISDDEFRKMKNTAVYIAVGRGPTTNNDAIIRALESGEIAGAGLDVVDPEPLPVENPLWSMKNVYIGSHNAGGTDCYAQRTMEIFFHNLKDYLAGNAPTRNLVDFDRQY